jgi:hypothetical protein
LEFAIAAAAVVALFLHERHRRTLTRRICFFGA